MACYNEIQAKNFVTTESESTMVTLVSPVTLESVVLVVYAGKQVLEFALAGYDGLTVLASQQVEDGWQVVLEGLPDNVGAFLPELLDMGIDRGGDAGGDFVLELEQVVQPPVETARPDRPARLRVDQVG